MSGVWSFGVPLEVSLAAPSNGAVVSPGAVTLEWQSTANTGNHRYIVSTSQSFIASLQVDDTPTVAWDCSTNASTCRTGTTTGRSVSINDTNFLSAGQTFYWRVRAANADVGNSITGYQSFSTAAGTGTRTLSVSSRDASGVAISASPSGYSGTTNYSKTGIANGTSIVLNAPASAPNATFIGWSGCDSSAGIACTVTMNAAKNVTANYANNGRSNQTIAFGAAPTVRVGGTGTVSATASSNLPVTLASLTSNVCTLSGNTVRGVAAGTCVIAADQAGSSSYNPAPQARQNIAVADASASCPRSADPGGKYKEWDVPGLFEVKTPALRGGNASHNLSPAELIYHSAKDQANNDGDRRAINPLLLITKLETEQSLVSRGESYTNSSGRGFEWRLKWAVGYGVCDICTDTRYPGFYPQMIGSAYQWWDYRRSGKTFRQGLETYTSAIATEWENFRSNYRNYANAMNRIAGKAYPVEISLTDTHPYNSFLDVTAEHIQQLLNEQSGALKETDLFRQSPVTTEVDYPCDTVVLQVSHFDGTGSLVDPRGTGVGCAGQGGNGCWNDYVALHPRGIPSTALFQVVGVKGVCESVELSGLYGEADVELRSWAGYGTESTFYRLDKLPALIPLKHLVSGDKNVDGWNLIALTTTSAVPAGSVRNVKAQCVSFAATSNARAVTGVPTRFDNEYYWGGNGSIIGHSNSSETVDAIGGYGRTRDSAVLMRDRSTLSALQVTKSTCSKLRFRMKNPATAGASFELSWKDWDKPDWLGFKTVNDGELFSLPGELGYWVVLKIKASATNKNDSNVTAICE